MNRIKFALLAGLCFGVLDIIPMIVMDFPQAAIWGALINRFAIGFLIPLVDMPYPGWLRGLIVGILLSVPDAIITEAYAPILSTGILGGLIIGYLVQRWEKKREASESAAA